MGLRPRLAVQSDSMNTVSPWTAERLGAAMMPLGEFTKSTTRQMAADLDLAVANKPESQDICFVPFKRYTEFIELYAPEVLQPGPIVDGQGQVLGEHKGVALHTVAQRRGLGIATGQPMFVTGLVPEAPN